MGDKKTKVLVTSTDPQFLNGCLNELKINFNVQVAASPDMAQFLIKEWSPNIALVDADCPATNILNKILNLTPFDSLGLIVLSTNPNAIKEEKAFRQGADHYLSTTDSYKSLSLRIESLSRRLPSSNSQPQKIQMIETQLSLPSAITFMNIHIYPKDYLVKRHQEIINTTPTQFRLLLAFVTHKEQLLSRKWLQEHVWENAKISHRSIDAQISKLKKQIPELDCSLMNVYGKGYILAQPQKNVA